MSYPEDMAGIRAGRFTMLHVTIAAVVSGMLAVMGAVTFGFTGGEHEIPELAPYMSQVQAFSQKLGYSIESRNQPLAEFCLHEIEEAFEEIEEQIPEHDEMPIAQYISTMMNPGFEPFHKALRTKNWEAVQRNYLSLIKRCNSCHVQTEHEFIWILPASGKPPFNQKF